MEKDMACGSEKKEEKKPGAGAKKVAMAKAALKVKLAKKGKGK